MLPQRSEDLYDQKPVEVQPEPTTSTPVFGVTTQLAPRSSHFLYVDDITSSNDYDKKDSSSLPIFLQSLCARIMLATSLFNILGFASTIKRCILENYKLISPSTRPDSSLYRGHTIPFSYHENLSPPIYVCSV